GHLKRAAERYARGDYDLAIKDLDEAIRLDPSCAPAFSGRGGGVVRQEGVRQGDQGPGRGRPAGTRQAVLRLLPPWRGLLHEEGLRPGGQGSRRGHPAQPQGGGGAEQPGVGGGDLSAGRVSRRGEGPPLRQEGLRTRRVEERLLPRHARRGPCREWAVRGGGPVAAEGAGGRGLQEGVRRGGP